MDSIGKTVSEIADKLNENGKTAIIPTKVGYIIVATDDKGLESKFNLKNRDLNKPAVTLVHDLDLFHTFADVRDDNGRNNGYYSSDRHLVDTLYKSGELTGIITKWKPDALDKYVDKKTHKLMTSQYDGTTCFVFNHGQYSELLAYKIWDIYGKPLFASSANPSGKGNRGKFQGIGKRILYGVDASIKADDYVAAQQPNKSEYDRFAQGVMIILDGGNPKFVRHGLGGSKIAGIMTEVCGYNRNWDYRPGLHN